jgi:arabinofuranosyltransferase
MALERFFSRHRHLILALILCVSGLLAVKMRFVQDDAFISFSYARSLLQGTGLAWFGTHVEGYTNFLWVLWIALGMKIGIDPVHWSYVGGIGAFLTTICGLYRLAYCLFNSRFQAFITVLLLMSNYTAVSFSTGGMETMLQTALVCLSAAIMCERAFHGELTFKYSIIIAFLFCLAFLTRVDSALPLLILFVFGIIRSHNKRYSLAGYAWIAAVCVVIGSLWLIWKYSYYGELLPNTYYAKTGGGISTNGFLFIGRFLHAYFIWPFAALGAIMMLLRRRELPSLLPPFMAVLAAWCAYIVYIGGDFMEFRYFVPIAPFLMLVVTYIVWFPIGSYLVKKPLVTTLISVLILISASYAHSQRFKGITEDEALDSIDALATFYGVYPDRNWREIGDRLKSEFSGYEVTLALHAAGAIPFYSELKSIDMWGLNDIHIARHGRLVPSTYLRPGHRRHATVSYLRSQGVNFIIGHPTRIPPGFLSDRRTLPALRDWLLIVVEFNTERISNVRLVAIPIDSESSLLTWYLTATPELDEVIRSRGWESTYIP